MVNGHTPPEMPTFMSSSIRHELRSAKGAKLSAREITERIGRHPGTLCRPSGAMKNVIRILSRMTDCGEVRRELAVPARPEIVYWIEPQETAHG
jgi:hypothetical protein